MQPEPLELDQLVAEVLDLYRSGDAAGKLKLKLRAKGLRVEGDPLRLRQVVHNLVKNAQEAVSGQDESLITVSTRRYVERDCEFVELRVADNGPGFNDQVLPHLFEPYVTTKAKGTGLGMAIVKKIVEEHGGMISAENCGVGACVIFRLPVVAAIRIPEKAARRGTTT